MRTSGLVVTGCASPVIVDATHNDGVARAESSTDVRFRSCQLVGTGGGPVTNGLDILGARVEVTGSTVSGGSGPDNPSGVDGAPAITCTLGGELHLSGSDVQGGHGGSWMFDFGTYGEGAYAIIVGGAGSQLLATGNWAITGATVEVVDPIDPSLASLGTQGPGDTVTFVLRGPPGTSARLRLGRAPVVVDLPGSWEDRLIAPLRTFSLGGIPPSGEVQFPIVLSTMALPGSLIMAQGSITDDAGVTELTQSVPLIVR